MSIKEWVSIVVLGITLCFFVINTNDFVKLLVKKYKNDSEETIKKYTLWIVFVTLFSVLFIAMEMMMIINDGEMDSDGSLLISFYKSILPAYCVILFFDIINSKTDKKEVIEKKINFARKRKFLIMETIVIVGMFIATIVVFGW